MTVCGTCGVAVTYARSGRLVHLDDIPDGVPHDHEIAAAAEADYLAGANARVTLKGAAEDMLRHHGTLHPDEGCEWVAVLRRALAQSA